MAPAFPQGPAAGGDAQAQSAWAPGGHHHPQDAHFASNLLFLVSDQVFFSDQAFGLSSSHLPAPSGV